MDGFSRKGVSARSPARQGVRRMQYALQSLWWERGRFFPGILSVTFAALLRTFAGEGRQPRFVPVPWRALYWPLRTLEAARVPLPFRADSLLGLVRPAPSVPGVERLHALGIHAAPFATVPS